MTRKGGEIMCGMKKEINLCVVQAYFIVYYGEKMRLNHESIIKILFLSIIIFKLLTLQQHNLPCG